MAQLPPIRVAGLLLALGACAPAPGGPELHPALRRAELPPLIPVESFLDEGGRGFTHRLSPDGKRLAWIEIGEGSADLRVRELASGEVIRMHPKGQAIGIGWAADSRHLLISDDAGGDENFGHRVVDTARPGDAARDLMREAGIRVDIDGLSQCDRREVFARSNRRQRAVFDLVAVDVETGIERMVERNPGNVRWWQTDLCGQALLRASGRRIEFRAGPGSAWRAGFELGRDDSFTVIGRPRPGEAFHALSDRGRDRVALVRVDPVSGTETVLAEDPAVDIQSAFLDPADGRPLAAFAMPGHPRAILLDAGFALALAPIRPAAPHRLGIISASDDGRRLVVAVTTERQGGEVFLVDRDGRPPERLTTSRIGALGETLADSEPISFPARDGRLLHGYLTRPPGVGTAPPPGVLLVHGGPWSRDEWGYDSLVQLLANRGYAVLRVNYRGSTGYGRVHRLAAIGEFGQAMQTDLLDALTFAGSIGAIDLQRVAIMGSSYGGYAALVGLTMTPERFAAAISVVGISDLARFLETVPPYWQQGIQGWYLYVGDPGRTEQRRAMLARSPLTFAGQARAPALLVHGSNDVRVRAEQSVRMAEALWAEGKTAELILFDDEGHGVRRRGNRLRLYRAVERFLAEHLGGRAAPAQLADRR